MGIKGGEQNKTQTDIGFKFWRKTSHFRGGDKSI